VAAAAIDANMLTAAQVSIAYAMSEDTGPDSLLANVCKQADEFGLYWHHQRNSIGSKRGWPDLVIVGRFGGIFRELKTMRGRLTRDQRMVGIRLRAARFDWDVWTPSHLLDGTIMRELLAIA
jgi:hypothetical protein